MGCLQAVAVSTVAFVVNQYRDNFTTLFNTYDPPDHPGASLAGNCIFCDIVINNNRELIYEDNLVVAFNDIRPASNLHVLIIPKRHIRDINHLQATSADYKLLKHMQAIGFQILTDRH